MFQNCRHLARDPELLKTAVLYRVFQYDRTTGHDGIATNVHLYETFKR